MRTRREFIASVGAAAVTVAASTSAWAKRQRVKVGVCSRDLTNAVKYGFAYLEPAAADIAAMNEEQFAEFSNAVKASPIRCEAFNSFIRRPDLKVVGDHVPTDALREYVDKTLERCRSLGAACVVWGSAGSRNVPEGFSRDRANSQIAEFLRMTGDIARRHDIVVAIEPLHHQESNILNTGAESHEMVRLVHHPNIKMIVDYYHLRDENEDLSIVETARRDIVHFHFANPHGRVWPHDMSEDDQYAKFFALLKKIHFEGGISIEGKGTFDNDAKASLAFFQKALA